MPGPCKGYTTPHRCATVNESKRHQASDRDQQARCKLQEKALDFHANFHGPVYLSIEPEAKRYKYNIFDPDKPHLYTHRSTINGETTTGRDKTRR